MKNIVILSYLKPQSFNVNYSSFLYKLNSNLYTLIEESKIDVLRINSIVEMLRKFSTNVFKSQNETLIRQVLDLNLAKLLCKTLKLARSIEYKGINIKETLNMLSLFLVDDVILEYFLNSNLGSEIFFFMKEDRLEDQSSIINSVTILGCLFKLKSYVFSKPLKVDFLAFILKHYETAQEETFKNDLLQMLVTVYEIKEFKKLLHDEEVVIDLRYRTDIQELEDMIQYELKERDLRLATRPPPREPPIKKSSPEEWLVCFPLYTTTEEDGIGVMNHEMMTKIERDEKYRQEAELTEYIAIQSKLRRFQEFLADIESNQPSVELVREARKVYQETLEMKELMHNQQDQYGIKMKSQISDLSKENLKLRKEVDDLLICLREKDLEVAKYEEEKQKYLEEEQAYGTKPPMYLENSRMFGVYENTGSELRKQKEEEMLPSINSNYISRGERLDQNLLKAAHDRERLPSIQKDVPTDSKDSSNQGGYSVTGPQKVNSTTNVDQPSFAKAYQNPNTSLPAQTSAQPPSTAKKYPALTPAQLNHSREPSPTQPLTSSQPPAQTSKPSHPITQSEGPSSQQGQDTRFLRAQIDLLEKKLNDSLNMLSEVNKKEIGLKIENRKLRSQLDYPIPEETQEQNQASPAPSSAHKKEEYGYRV